MKSEHSVSNWLNFATRPHAAFSRDVIWSLNDAGFMARPVWEPMHTLTLRRSRALLPNTSLAERIISLPSSAKLVELLQ